MKVVFMGTPDFAVVPLEMLIKNNVNIIGVVTQPDRPAGRKKVITAPPVKKLASNYDIPVYQPEKVKSAEFIKILKSLEPDLIIVVAFGQILSRDVLDIPKIGCINVHASLLPKYRGAAPIQWAIINGEKVTGVTTMWMDEGVDTGDIFMQEKIEIDDEWTSLELSCELSKLGGKLLIKTLENIKSGNLIRVPQNHEEATYAPMLKKDDGKINWFKTTWEIYNLIRGMYPWPTAFTLRNKTEFKILKARPYLTNAAPNPGKYLGAVKNEGFLIGTGDGSLLVLEVQESGKKRMKATEYLAGHTMNEGEFFADDVHQK
ncbi:methionyl-tRNA formyltransferase [Tepidanaerobacter syntrophicus]|uniref:methionyl-tRNA formyltransferase n=1 Tax=Tepidanaerobacter syntrophicus TaxID=224999 RepID=UPI001BD47E50|nr:methionyl-tRNA formyltransferase [Tepidanaerobacter syntrophicus]